MHILVLEASTTSAKAMLYNTEDHSSKVMVEEYHGNPADPTLHDAENVYQQLLAVGRKVSEKVKPDMISLCTTWHSLLVCNRDMEPQSPVYLWCYDGASELCRKKRKDHAYVNTFYHKTGCMVHASYPFFKIELLKQQGMNLKDMILCGQGTYLNYRLTGEKKTTACMASGTGLLNIHTKKYDSDLLKELDVETSQLFEIVDTFETYPLLSEAAEELGVREGIPVVLANSDGGLNQIGAGGLEEGVMSFSVGTSGAMRLTVPEPRLMDLPGTWCYLSPGGWLSGAATSGACNCIDWVKNQFFPEGCSYEELEAGVRHPENVPVFLPFLFGERCPGWNDERKGGFYEVTVEHDKYDFYRAVQEGVLFNLYHCYCLLEDVNGTPERIRFSGGILHSEKWAQMCADIFQRDLEVDDNQHSSMLGGAIIAMEIAGIPHQTMTKQVIHPRREMAKMYQEKYERYLQCYNKEI